MIAAPTPEAIRRAAELLRAGELVAIPTETVYGLAADARNPDALRKIFAAKGRPTDHPLIVHLPDAAQLGQWAVNIPNKALALAAAFWPGPLTLILQRAEGVPEEVTGGQATVGVRVPNHPVALALLRSFNAAVAAPSANRFGRISPTTAAHVRDELGNSVALVLDGGPCEVGIESTILDLSRDPPAILRPGAISAAQIAEVIGCQPRLCADRGGASSSGEPRVPGSLAAHYSPRTPMKLCTAESIHAQADKLAALGTRVAVLARTCVDPRDPRLVWHSAPVDPAGYAHELYASLRTLDQSGAQIILVESPPGANDWRAVADRLGRAATGSGAQAAG